MKQKRFGKKLDLNKKTLVNLNGGEMGRARGGHDTQICPTMDTCLSRSCGEIPSVCICLITKGC